MIARNHRFHGHNSLRTVYKTGQTIRGPLANLRYVYNPRRRTYRVAVVVSRKVHKSAVVRNRIRRRMYEIIRQYQNLQAVPYDLVFVVVTATVAELPATKLQNDIARQLQKLPLGTPQPAPAHGIVNKKET